MSKKIIRVCVVASLAISTGCVGLKNAKQSSDNSWFLLLLGLRPAAQTSLSLNPLSISQTTTASITLVAPVASSTSDVTLQGYIGSDSNVSVSGSSVSGSVQGPVDVSSGRTFSGLSSNTTYRIVVVAEKSGEYAVQQVTQSTGQISPVLNALSISGSNSSSITLSQPTFSTAGNPAPSVNAYIGADGSISVSGSVVTGASQGPIDVSSSGYQFSGLSSNSAYRLIVVAKNGSGYSVQQIVQNTSAVAPVLNGLSIASTDSSSISVSQPSFSTAGNPAPTTLAYLGLNGSVSVSGSIVSGFIQGPADVSAGSYQFSSLGSNTSYRIVVVSQNSAGYSVQQIVQSTAALAPVLSGLSISSSDSSSITLAQPTFSTTGNPAPTVNAYIGLDGTISVSGSTVSGSSAGPINVASGAHQFSSLSSNTAYRLIVVASNSAGYSVQQIAQNTAAVAPVMNALSISSSDSSSISLNQPGFSTAGNPLPTVSAYIGLNGTISVSGSTVSNSVAGPVNVSTGGTQFGSLNSNTSYRIIVVASNSAGYSVQQIVQSTAGVAPVLNSLSVSASDSNSITISQPTFATSGNPAPTVQAYIGVTGTISASGSTISGSIQGPIDVSTGGYQFSSLNSNTAYTVIVLASNSTGYSIQQIAQSTAAVAPVLNSLNISATDSSSISISQPTFSTAGNPSPTVNAYIGLSGTISVSGSVVSGSVQGPINVASGGTQFSSLSANTAYKIFVVSQNTAGYSVQQITQSTAGVAPVLNALSINTSDSSSITIAQPTFSTSGNPAPTVSAYIGINGTISLSGSTVSNSIQGPVDVSTGGYQFSSLDPNTAYRIIVIAQNSAGYFAQQIVQSTAGIAPVLNSLSVGATDSTSITLLQPTLSTAGNPSPTVRAYIGVDGTISLSGATVSNSIQGPIDVASGGYQFSSLSGLTSYRIIVVAENAAGNSVQQIVQSTTGIAPSMNTIGFSNYDTTSVTLAQPTFAIAGNPTPTVRAYIGLQGTISVSGSVVSNFTEGPADVATGGYQFSGLTTGVVYTVIVIAQNASGYSVRQISQSARASAPTIVYGQGNMTSNTINSGGVSATAVGTPFSGAFDSAGNLYLGDTLDHRVLFFPAGSTTATRVYGQPNFTSSGSNNGGVSATSLANPRAMAIDSAGNLYVGDHGNFRVLYFPAGSTTATRVYGQPNFTSNTPNNGGVSATSLNGAPGIALDSADNLYVVDEFNARVLFYPNGSTTATRVYGQPDFTSSGNNTGGISATSLNTPIPIALDSAGNLYVGDNANNRVLFYPAGSTTATRVYGQPNFTSNTTNNGGVSATSLFGVFGVSLDPSGNLYVSDVGNHRVLFFPAGNTTATRVYGQPDFTSNTANNGGVSATSLNGPAGTLVDPAGHLYIFDWQNGRVLFFP